MVMKPRFTPEMEREGRLHAESHPEERRRVLEACDAAAGARVSRETAEVLIWGNSAFVKPYEFLISRDDDGKWKAVRVYF